MNELIKVTTNENNERLVSGRELHEFLEVKDNYTDWFKRMIGYGFTENVDFSTLSEKSDKPFGGRPKVNHAVSLDMAKEVSMIQRTEKGKQARQYFVQVEKEYKQQLDISNLSPELQMFQRIFQSVASQELATKKLETKVDNISEIVALNSTDWRNDSKKLIRKMANKVGGDPEAYREIQNAIYTEVDRRAKADLGRRLSNLRDRMAGEGVSKSKRDKTNKLDVIESDKRLLEIYLAIVKEFAVKYKVWNDEF
ncbi:antA/AntB antirepressor family protein [Enterococcus olivae]